MIGEKKRGFADLTGKVAIVTGAGSGIGRAAALALARQGAHVAGVDINPAGGRETAELAKADGLSYSAHHPVDLTNPDEAMRLAETVVADHGGIDILANIAGYTAEFVPFPKTSLHDHLHHTFKGEIDITFIPTQAVWPHMIARGGGSIINTGSAVAHLGFQHMPALPHVSAKGAVLSMTRQLAAEGAPHSIRVNTVSPGYTATPQSEAAMNDKLREVLLSRLLVKRIGMPEDIAGCIVFLASDESSWVTGAEYLVDGGITAN